MFFQVSYGVGVDVLLAPRTQNLSNQLPVRSKSLALIR